MELDKLISSCKCGIYININEYRDAYQTVEEGIKEINSIRDEIEIDDELAKRMIKENTIISLQFYPDTPIGSYTIYGTSVDEVLKEALIVVKEK
jgi:hypothetical protein